MIVGLASVALSSAVLAQEAFAPPDPATGSIDGRTAIGFWVLDRFGPDAVFLDPGGFEVHLIPAADPLTELIQPCGRWLTIPPGRYRAFVQGEGRISPVSVLFSYNTSPFRGRGLVVPVPTVEAGSVMVSRDLSLPETAALRLMHLDSHHLGQGALQRELSRNAEVESARRTGVPMPAGPVLVAAIDKSTGEYLALARPVEVPKAGAVVADLQPPREGQGALVTIVWRSRPGGRLDEDDLELAWIGAGGSSQVPDVTIRGGSFVYGFWYGLEGSGSLRLDSREGSVTEPIEIRPGSVLRQELHAPPASEGR
jgi:hypothetical protein